MLALDRSHDTVFLVTAPIPLIGAQPGDELVIRPTNATYPVTLLRRPAPELVAAIPESAVRFLAAYEPDDTVPVGQDADGTDRPALRLVP